MKLLSSLFKRFQKKQTNDELKNLFLVKMENAEKTKDATGFFTKSYYPLAMFKTDLVMSNKLQRMISLIKTPARAKKIKNLLPGDWVDVQELLRERREELCLDAAKNISSINQAKNLAKLAPYNGEAFKKICTWWADSCQTFPEIRGLISFLARAKHSAKESLANDLDGMVAEKLQSILIANLKGNTNKKVAKRCYIYAFPETIVKFQFFVNWISLCRTKEDFEDAIYRAKIFNDVDCIKLAIEKASSLFKTPH